MRTGRPAGRGDLRPPGHRVSLAAMGKQKLRGARPAQRHFNSHRAFPPFLSPSPKAFPTHSGSTPPYRSSLCKARWSGFRIQVTEFCCFKQFRNIAWVPTRTSQTDAMVGASSPALAERTPLNCESSSPTRCRNYREPASPRLHQRQEPPFWISRPTFASKVIARRGLMALMRKHPTATTRIKRDRSS